MKIRLLEEKLVNELKNTKLKYRKKDYEKIKKEPIIIGITGSRGKSSVCYLLHQYLKNKGYKSVLYSSIEIDSELSYTKKHCAVDNPLKSRETLLNAVCQCIDSNADFLILEVNERANLGIFLGMQNPLEIDGVTNADFLRTALHSKMGSDFKLMPFIKELNATTEHLKIDKERVV